MTRASRSSACSFGRVAEAGHPGLGGRFHAGELLERGGNLFGINRLGMRSAPSQTSSSVSRLTP